MIAHRQVITAGSQFTGVAPGGAATTTGSMKTWATHTLGGLFDPLLGSPGQIVGFELKGGSQSSWTLRRVHADASVGATVFSGTTGDYATAGGVWLGVGEKLKLESSGASTEISAVLLVRTMGEV